MTDNGTVTDLLTRLRSATGPDSLTAISLWQPWASFIAIGIKPYETRHWRPPGRLFGQRIAIHAAKRKMDKDDIEWWRLVSKSDDMPPLGAFVCTAILRACMDARSVPFDEYGDYGEGRFAWHLTEIEPIDPPIPAVGRQGFWTWERPVAALSARNPT